MTTQVEELGARLDAAFKATGSATDLRALTRPLLTLLTAGQPVSAEQLAAATGRSVKHIAHSLPSMPSIELDEQGRVVGMGITLNPTPHGFEVDGTDLFTWCALDTLIFPALIGRPAHVSSSCHATGEPIRLTVNADGGCDVTPSTAVISIVTPDDVSVIPTSFCNEVHLLRIHRRRRDLACRASRRGRPAHRRRLHSGPDHGREAVHLRPFGLLLNHAATTRPARPGAAVLSIAHLTTFGGTAAPCGAYVAGRIGRH